MGDIETAVKWSKRFESLLERRYDARGGTGRVGVGREEVTNPVGRPAEGPEGLLTEGCDPVDRSRLPCHRLDAVGGTGVRCAFGDCHASPPSSLRSDGRTALYPTLRTVPISDS